MSFVRTSFFCLIAFSFSTTFALDMRFQKACDPGETLVIGAVGDVLLHGPLQTQGYAKGFGTLWKTLLPYMEGPDMMYANLEGPAAAGVSKGGKVVADPGLKFDGNVYSGYPLFNYNPIIIKELQDGGVDIVSTSNNHSLDRGAVGIRKTMEALDEYGMPYVGTRYSKDDAYHNITFNGSWKLGWIACTYDTNGIPDKEDIVLDCYDGRVTELIKELAPQVDAVIVTPHWGLEYQLKPQDKQIKFARKWLDDGAHAIIGAHPHVPQPWEKYQTADGREGLILYSLGNFVSNQSGTAKQSSLLLYVGLSKSGGKTWVNGARYVPLYMQRKPYEVVPSNFLTAPNSAEKASLKLVKDMFGEDRIVNPGEDVVTNAECF